MRRIARSTAAAVLITIATCSAAGATVLPAGAVTAAQTTVSTAEPRVMIGTASFPTAGSNVRRGADDLVVYTRSSTQSSTPTNRWGLEVTVVGGRVTAVSDRERTGVGPTALPVVGVVLSGHGKARTWLLQHAKLGATGLSVPGDVTTVAVGNVIPPAHRH